MADEEDPNNEASCLRWLLSSKLCSLHMPVLWTWYTNHGN